MAIDIRATVTCSLGTLISGSISDDYVQGSGLIKTKGSVELSGIVTPAVGTAVTFSYTKGGVTRSIPRKLRVLSSFADPFRRTTKVELGCKLTYLSDLQEPIKWTADDDTENAGITTDDQQIITRPISASSIYSKCLLELGLNALSNPGLTNKFSVAEFDLSPGYVQVLSDLLVSECKCGFLNGNEELVFFSLNQDGGTGPVLDSSKLIDIGPIGVGQLPGEAVVVSYNTLRLKNATEDEPADSTVKDPVETAEEEGFGGWERSKNSSVVSIPVQYTVDGSNNTRVYNVLKTSETATTYGPRIVNGKTENLVVRRVTTNTTSSVDIAGGAVAEYLSNGIDFPDVRVTEEVREEFQYDSQGNEQYREQTVYHSGAHIACGASVPFVFSPTDYVSIDFTRRQLVSRTKTYTTTAKNKQLVQSYQFLPWSRTLNGQQTIAQGRDSFANAAEVEAYLSKLYSQTLSLANVETVIQTTSRPQAAPTSEDIINDVNADKPDSTVAADGQTSDDYRTESQADMELAVGSATAQRRIELSMPYAPDDIFRKTGTAPNVKYWALKSNAAQKAKNFGRAQNALLLGNRSGMNVQTAPEVMPEEPFAPVVVQANGLSALYRMNGTSWQMDANGVLLSSDLLFWGAVGGTGTFWFPVAPGITTLPTAPAVVDGQMTVTATVPVWNETVLMTAGTRTKLSVTSLSYPLSLLTAVAVTTRTRLLASRPLIGATGAVSLMGEQVTLAKTSVLTAEADSFLLSGQPAMLEIYPYRLICNSGTYTLTGNDAYREARIITGTAAPLLGAGGATTYTGWTRIQNASIDDGSIGFLDWAFSVTLDSTAYNGVYVGSNTYLTFGGGSSAYTGLGASAPSLPKILFGGGDHSYQRIYTFTGQAADNSAIAKLRFEGSSTTAGTLGSPTIVAEFTFYAPRANGDQWIELRVGNHDATTDPFMIASASTAYATATIAANTSWLFVGNSAGTSWTLTSNRYVD